MKEKETHANKQPQGIHIVAKPSGPRCNLNCAYCFYLEKQALFPNTWVAKAAMPQLIEHVVSLKKEPPIKPGTKDPYVPQKP